MYRTCTIQVNLDFESEADMRRKMQVSLKLQPLSTALFANSPFTDGRPEQLQSWRGEIWRDTDNQRSGLQQFYFSPDFGFADYVEDGRSTCRCISSMLRDGRYDMTRFTFRQFMAGGAQRHSRRRADHVASGRTVYIDAVSDVPAEAFPGMRGADGGRGGRSTAGLLGRTAL